MNKPIDIRQSTLADIPRLQEIFAIARRFMAATGNPNQWADGYPGEELLRSDIASGDSYVVILDGRIVATFYCWSGAERLAYQYTKTGKCDDCTRN